MVGQALVNLSIYLDHRVELIDYSTAIVGDRSQGEDVFHEAFIRLKSSATDRSFEEPVGYLRRIIRNLAIDWIRRVGVERRRYDDNADLRQLLRVVLHRKTF